MNEHDYKLSYREDTDWQMHRLHFHDNCEIALFLNEKGQFFLDNGIYSLHENQLAIVPSATLHRTEQEHDGSVFRRYILHIRPQKLSALSTANTNFLQAINRKEYCLPLQPEQASLLIDYFKRLGRIDYTCFGDDIRADILLQEILLLLCSILRTEPQEKQLVFPDSSRIQPILSYIQEHYTEALTLDDLAHRFLLSKYYMCHFFKKCTGFSVMEYVIQLRIMEAQRLLRQGIAVQDAGERSGFQTCSYFIHTFKSNTGISPKQYAKKYCGAEGVTHMDT